MIKKLVLSGLFLSILLLSNCGKENIEPIKDIGIYINEIDANGTDWIELYNSTSEDVSLAGFKIYDDPTEKYTIPSGTILANGFYILYCDGTGVGGNASFGLSSAGETIYIEDDASHLIDKVTFPSIDNGSSYARFPDGGDNWRLTGVPTKESTNGSAQAATISNAGRLPIVPNKSQAVIVSATILDVEGISTVKLFSRKDGAAFTSVNMTLVGSTYSATIPATTTLGQVDYYIEVVNSRGVTTRNPENAPAKTDFYILNEDVLPNLVINEFMASNSSCCPDNNSGIAEYNDWIEIYNGEDQPVNMDGFYLSDSNGNPFKFKIEGSTVIPAGGFLLIWADEQGSQGKLHASFQLAAAGEEVGLFYKDGRTIDTKTFGIQAENVSYGRTTNGGDVWRTFSTPTPEASNQ